MGSDQKKNAVGRNVHAIVNDTVVMLKTATVAALLVLLAGCSGSEPAANAPPSTATTTARDYGAEIDDRGDTIAAIINAGCGAAPKPTCEASGEQLASHVRLLRKLIVESGRSEFYSPALELIDQVQDATSSTERRAAAIDLVDWLEMNPT